jgi:hypothetical protein
MAAPAPAPALRATLTPLLAEGAPSPRAFFAAAAVRGADGAVVAVAVHGGVACEGAAPLADAFVLDCASWRWRRVPDAEGAAGARSHHVAWFAAGRVWLFGGWDGRRRSAALHSLSWPELRWADHSAAQSRIDPHSSHAAVALDDGRALVVGRGETGTHKRFGCNVDVLELAALRWHSAPGVTASRAGHSATLLPARNAVALFGGRHSQPLLLLPLPPPHSKAESALPPPPPAPAPAPAPAADASEPVVRAHHAAAALRGGALVHGGFRALRSASDTRRALSDAHWLDPLRLRWARVEGAWPARAGHALVAVGDARAVLFGGVNEGRVAGDALLVEVDWR